MLHLYKYAFDPQTKSLGPAEPLEWSLKLHEQYFPSQTFHLTIIEYFQARYSLPFEIERWIEYPIDVLLQSLAPHRKLSNVMSLIQGGKWEELVRNLRGVDPAVLCTYPINDGLVLEAYILWNIAQNMIDLRKIWLSMKDLFSLNLPQHESAIQRLLIEKILIRKGDFVTLCWTIRISEKFQKMLETGHEFIHDSTVPPCSLFNLRFPLPLQLCYDTNRAIDHFVWNESIAITMWCGSECQVMKWTKQIEDVLPREISVPHILELKRLIYVDGLHESRTLIVSECGSMSFLLPSHVLIEWIVPCAPFQVSEISLVKQLNPSTFQMMTPPRFCTPEQLQVLKTIQLPASVIYNSSKKAGQCTFLETLNIATNQYDHVILVGNCQTRLTWKREVMRIVEGDVNKCRFYRF